MTQVYHFFFFKFGNECKIGRNEDKKKYEQQKKVRNPKSFEFWCEGETEINLYLIFASNDMNPLYSIFCLSLYLDEKKNSITVTDRILTLLLLLVSTNSHLFLV